MAEIPSSGTRDLIELFVGYGAIIGTIWSPGHWQNILSPFVLVLTLGIILWRRPSRDDLGVGMRGLFASLWILPAAIGLAAASVFVAARLGTLHPLYHADTGHVMGYILWTIYQQVLLQDYFMPRLEPFFTNDAITVTVTGVLFAAAHLPNLVLVAATLVWGIVSCAVFRRYRNLWILGLAQGLLGLCFAVCVPDAMHHHLRVGLGYLRYRGGNILK